MTKQKTVLDIMLDEQSANGTTLQEFIDAVIVMTKDYHSDINPSTYLRNAIESLEQARAYITLADEEMK